MADVVGQLVIQMQADVARLRKDMQDATGSVQSASRDMERNAKSVKDALGAIGAGFSVVAIVAGLKALATSMLEAQNQTDKFRSAMASVAGEANVARELEFVRTTARTLGIDLQTTADAYVKLSAASRGTAIAGEETRAIFTAVSKAATTLGLSSEETNGALLAISQMMSKGTVSAEELRGQLGERMPGAFQIAARAMGVTTTELGKMLEQGQVIADDFLPKFAKQLELELGEGAVKASESAGRAMTRLKNEWGELVRAVADSGLADAVASVMSMATAAIGGYAETIRRAKAEGAGFWGQVGAVLFGAETSSSSRIADAQKNLANPNLDAYTRKRYQEQLAQAQRDARALTPAGPTDDEREDQKRVDALEAERKKVEEVRSAYMKWAQDSSGQHKDYQKNLAMLAASRDAGIISEAKYVAEVQKLIVAQGGVKVATKARADGEREAEQQAKKLGEAYLDVIGISRDYTERVRTLESLYKSGRISVDEYTREVAELAAAQPIVKKNTEETAKAQRDLEAAEKAATEARIASVKSLADEAKSLADQVKAQREQNEEIGKTGQALFDVRDERAAGVIAIKEQTLAMLEATEGTDAEVAAMRLQVEQLKSLRTARREAFELQTSADAAEAARKAGEAANAEWARQSETIEKSLTDSLMRGFEGGKGFLQNLVDTAKNLFQSLILRPTIQAIVGPIAGGLGGSLGLSGSANAATGGGGGIGDMLGSVGSLFGAGGLGGSLAAGAGWLTGATSFTGALGAAGSLVGTGTMGGIMSGIGMGLGALGPIALGAMALAAIFSKKGGPKSGGSYSTTGERLFTPNGSDAQLTGLGLDQQVSALAGMFGGSFGGSLGIGFDTDPQGTAANRVASFVRDAQGGMLLDNIISRDVGRDEAALQAELQAEAQRVLIAAMQGSNLPEAYAAYFRQFDPATLNAQQGEAIIAAATNARTMTQAVQDLGGVFATFGSLSVDARDGIVSLTGGLDQFVSKVTGYISNFYTSEEQASITAKGIKDALEAVGITTDLSSKGDFRALVDSLDVSTTKGQEQFATLLNVQAQFASIADYLTGNGKSLSAAAQLAPGGPAFAEMERQANGTEALVSQNAEFYTESLSVQQQTLEMITGLYNLMRGTATAPEPVS